MGTPIKLNLMVTTVILLQKRKNAEKNQSYFPPNGACGPTMVHLASKIHLSSIVAHMRKHAQV